MYSCKFVLLSFFANEKQPDIKIMAEGSFLSSPKHSENSKGMRILRKLQGMTIQKIEINDLPINPLLHNVEKWPNIL